MQLTLTWPTVLILCLDSTPLMQLNIQRTYHYSHSVWTYYGEVPILLEDSSAHRL